ncbi:MAG: hypothetical protein IJB86_06365 [Clostridia bacterium]|nr:hypothetical protein [Clostridia bacterium]
MFKRIIALTLTALLLVSAMIIPASAATTPTRLYVGEKNKSGDNIIQKYNRDGYLKVYSVNDNTSYYTLEYDLLENEYILSFYNNYKYSEPVEYGSSLYGIYCDGDLTIRVYGNAEFDLSKNPETGAPISDAYGVYVKGTLTIANGEGYHAYSNFTANGDKRKSSEYSDSIGIYADTVLINKVNVIANGGYAGVAAKNTIAVVDATLTSNRDSSMFSEEINPSTGKPYPNFEFGISTKLFIQAACDRSPFYCEVSVGGNIDIDSYIMRDAYSDNDDALVTNFDEDVVVYLKYIVLSHAWEGKVLSRGEEITLLGKNIPSCIYPATNIVVDRNGGLKWPTPRVSFSGQDVKVVDGDGVVGVGLYLDCGDATVCFDYTELILERTTLQKVWDFIAYYILFGWVVGKI